MAEMHIRDLVDDQVIPKRYADVDPVAHYISGAWDDMSSVFDEDRLVSHVSQKTSEKRCKLWYPSEEDAQLAREWNLQYEYPWESMREWMSEDEPVQTLELLQWMQTQKRLSVKILTIHPYVVRKKAQALMYRMSVDGWIDADGKVSKHGREEIKMGINLLKHVTKPKKRKKSVSEALGA